MHALCEQISGSDITYVVLTCASGLSCCIAKTHVHASAEPDSHTCAFIPTQLLTRIHIQELHYKSGGHGGTNPPPDFTEVIGMLPITMSSLDFLRPNASQNSIHCVLKQIPTNPNLIRSAHMTMGALWEMLTSEHSA